MTHRTCFVCIFLLSLIAYPSTGVSLELPSYLDINDIADAEFLCLEETVEYSSEDQEYIDILWNETLAYLAAYASALTTEEVSECLDSDRAVYETASDTIQRMCIMDNRDMWHVVKNIYQVIYNPQEARKCFSARADVDWIYSPGGELEANSPVAQWLNRTTFEEFFANNVTDEEVREYGRSFTRNFAKMVTGDDIKMPRGYPYDISANALPNLWAAAGWFPMYAEESERNQRNFMNVRGGYAYAEVFGHWGLLRVDEINGQKVGAEIGMTVQTVDTFYPYHNHAIAEIYYTIREPACVNQFRNFAIRADNPLVKTLREDDTTRTVTFDAGVINEHRMWGSTTPTQDPLLYLHRNTIHAFDIDGDCEAKPEEKAMVTVWARSDAHDLRNDYGTTLLCGSHEDPNTPAERGQVIECDLTNEKW